ncbi:MAG: transposase [Bradyrhizobium sp.]|nr:transposase [Bradyrhizobium sp.]
MSCDSQAFAFICVSIANRTVARADEAGSWGNFHERFEVERINHQKARVLDGACTNRTEKFFRRLRRAEIGIHPYIAGAHRRRSAQKGLRREDSRRESRRDRVSRDAHPALREVG